MKRALLAALLCVSCVALPGPAGAARVSLPAIDTEAEPCGIPPEATPPLATSTSPQLKLRARVLVERGNLNLVRSYLPVTKKAYDLIGITFKARLEEVDTPSEWATDSPDQPTILGFMHSVYPVRPPKTDVVYLFTRHWAGGFAECVGGVRFPDKAYAFGSIDYSLEDTVPMPTANEGVIAAHEIGHLLGAHHHYSNCTEALPQGALRGDANPCTVMSPAAATASTTFSLVERSFVRYYTEQFAGK